MNLVEEFSKNKAKYSNSWYCHTYQGDIDATPETCVTMAVRESSSKALDRYDILWIDSFGEDNRFTPKLLSDVSKETGLELENFTIGRCPQDTAGTVIASIDSETLKAFYGFSINWAHSNYKMLESVKAINFAQEIDKQNSKPLLQIV